MTRINKEHLQHTFLVWLACSAVIFSIPGLVAFREWRTVYWLNTDGKPAAATVTALERPLMKYAFLVGTNEYVGKVKVSRQREMEVGSKLEVFYSSSHPWISSLGKPPWQFQAGGYVAGCVFVCLVVLVVAVAKGRANKPT